MDDWSSTLTLHEYPLAFWITGVILLVSGVSIYLVAPDQPIMAAAVAATGVISLLAPSTLTITADRLSRVLTLRYRALLWGSKKEIPIQEIESIRVEISQSSGNSDTSGSAYRIVIVQRNGQVIPIHSYYSSGGSSKQKRAAQLREFLGVGGQDETPLSFYNLGPQLAGQAVQAQPGAVTSGQDEEHISEGVHWKLQTIALGGSSLTRWFSPDFQCPGGFLFLSQKVAGQKTMAGGLVGGMSKFLFQQSIRLYGFGDDDAPNLEAADLLAPLDKNLEPHFTAFASDPDTARRILNPWAATPLEDWATRHPLKGAQFTDTNGQLVVMFSPRGVYVASTGTITPEAAEDLTNLGVELIKAQ